LPCCPGVAEYQACRDQEHQILEVLCTVSSKAEFKASSTKFGIGAGSIGVNASATTALARK
jgi:hypothetical protein